MTRQFRLLVYIIAMVGLPSLIKQETMAMPEANNIQLPPPEMRGNIPLEEIISKRRSHRTLLQRDLGWPQISQLLWAAQGITGERGGFSFRAAPSAGALYPAELYVLTKGGLFHYLPNGHKLEVMREGDLRSHLAQSALGQSSISQAPVDIVICMVYSRVTAKYGQRGIRYVHMETGHIAQNIHLQATALNLASVPIGAFDDAQVKKALSLPEDHVPLYIIPIGYPD